MSSFLRAKASRVGRPIFIGLWGVVCGLLVISSPRAFPKTETPQPPIKVEGQPSKAETLKVLGLLDGEPALGAWLGLTLTIVDEPEKKIKGFGWRQLKGPKPAYTLTPSDGARVWTLLSKPGQYDFELFAQSSKNSLAATRLSFEVSKGKSILPLSEAFSKAGAGEQIELPGEGWQQIFGPPVDARLDTQTWKTTFRPLKAGLYLFEALRAGDTPQRRAILVPPGKDKLIGDRRPRAVVLPKSVNGVEGKPVTLDGSLSSDPDGIQNPLKPTWGGDIEKRKLLLISQKGMKATFTAPRKGVYRVQLVVNDGHLDSKPAEAFLRIREGQKTIEDTPSVTGLRPDPSDPLGRFTTLLLYESNLDRAIQVFPGRCKTTLRVAMDVARPERFAEMPINLGVRNAPVRLAADWIARQLGLAYRIESKESVWLTKPGHWWQGEKLKSTALTVDALYKAKDASDLLKELKYIFRGVLANRRDVSMGMTITDKRQNVMAVMPEKACDRLETLLVHLRAPEGFGLPAPPLPTQRERDMQKRLGSTLITVDWKARSLDLVLSRDLVKQSGFSVGFEPKEFPKGYPHITLSLKKVPLRQAIRDIVEAAGLKGCQVHPGGGLWFYKHAEPYPSGELLWDIAFVRAYKIDTLLKSFPMLSGEAIAHQIRRRVYASSWSDPSVSCLYHQPTGKLIIIHGPAAQYRVLELLNDLSARGLDALGPVKE